MPVLPLSQIDCNFKGVVMSINTM